MVRLFEVPGDAGLFGPPKSKVANLKHKDFMPSSKVEVKTSLFHDSAEFDGDKLMQQLHVCQLCWRVQFLTGNDSQERERVAEIKAKGPPPRPALSVG